MLFFRFLCFDVIGFFFSSRRRHTRLTCDWSSDVCSSDLRKVASNGSTFKNPAGDFAGRLIEAAGCKGWREGDAVCSPVHANWLVNTGRASAGELTRLIERVRDEVARVHGIQ